MRKISKIVIVLLLSVLTWPIMASDLISMGSSNIELGTQGFVLNEYDWMLNPLYFSKLEYTTLFLSLDSKGSQFDANSIGDGFRGAFALIKNGFSPIFAFNYFNNSTNVSSEEEDNSEITYGVFNTTTNTYATVDEDVDVTESSDSIHELKLHFGNATKDSINFALQFWLNIDQIYSDRLQYSDSYTNTISISDSTLDSMGNRIDTVISIPRSTNVIAIEPEIGLVIGNISSLISLGISFNNTLLTENSLSKTTTSYSGGINATVKDSAVITSRTGLYGTGNTDIVSMDTNIPTNAPVTVLNINTEQSISINDNTVLEFPFSIGLSLYSDVETTNTTTTINYDDSTDSAVESSRTKTSATVKLSSDYDIYGTLGILYKKSFTPTSSAALNIGGGLSFTAQIQDFTKTKENSITTQTDTNGNELYTDVVDVNTVYTESGYEIKINEADFNVICYLPISIEYSPISNLKFYAGTTTRFITNINSSSTLETGDSNYIYEEYSDNNDSTNSYDLRQKNGEDNTSTPVSSLETEFDFLVTSNFGFTLMLAENFKIDALAQASNVAFEQFSLTCIYSFK